MFFAIFIVCSYKVSLWLEQLHDIREEVTKSFNRMKSLLTKKVESMSVLVKIEELSQMVSEKMLFLRSIDNVGFSVDDTLRYLEMTQSIESDAHNISEKALRYAANCQSTVCNESSISTDCSIKAYQVLEKCAELQEHLDDINTILKSSLTFYTEATKVDKQLVEVENLLLEPNNTLSLEDETKKIQGMIHKILERGINISNQVQSRMGIEGIR